jgi:DNA-directed RNA polymerase subunit RPC12/RpoP
MRVLISAPIHLPRKFSIWAPAVLLAALTLMVGCGKPQKQSAANEVTGYLCPGCKAKFYVERAVVANFCPQCKGTDIQPIVGYVCATDGHLTLNTRRSKLLPCEQCGLQTSSVRQPTAAELEACGAVKKSRTEICRK